MQIYDPTVTKVCTSDGEFVEVDLKHQHPMDREERAWAEEELAQIREKNKE